MTTHSTTSDPAFKDSAQRAEALREAFAAHAPEVLGLIHTFYGSGLTPDIAEGRFIAAVQATLPNPRGKGLLQVLCSGQDSGKDLAELKALMELCERYVCTHRTNSYTISNGFAAHTNFDDAAYNALLEVIERDAFMRFWFAPERGRVLAQDEDVQKRARALDQVLQNAGVNSGSQVLLVQLRAQEDVPVVLAFLSAKDQAEAPALSMGAGASAAVDDAIDKALCELEVNTLNILARQARCPAWQDEKVSIKIESSCGSKEHTQLYHHPSIRTKLKFLDYLLGQKPTSLCVVRDGPYSSKEICLQNTVSEVTPEMLAGLAVVVHATIDDAYPLVFGFPIPFEFECTQLSVARELPHPFP